MVKEKNVFVVLGKDFHSKKAQIDKIKSFISQRVPSPILINLSSSELILTELQREMNNLSFQRRIFIFRNSENLSLDVKNYFKDIIKKRKFEDFLIFDFDVSLEERERLQEDSFFSFLFKLSPPYKIGKAFIKDFSLRDLEGALKKGFTPRALLILSYLLKRGRKERISLQILGMMIKIFVDYSSRIFKERNLRYIFEMERLIKEGKISPQLALELLIIRLTLQSS